MRLRLRLRARSLDVKRETAEINTAVEAGVSGIRTVKAFANEQDAMDKFRTSNEKFKKVKKAITAFSACSTPRPSLPWRSCSS